MHTQSSKFQSAMKYLSQLQKSSLSTDSAIGRAAVYHTEGCRFDPGSGHSKFLFLQREFTSALVLKLPGLQPIQSQRTLSFLSAIQEVSKIPNSNQMKLHHFFAYYHPLVIRLICRKAIRQMHTQSSKFQSAMKYLSQLQKSSLSTDSAIGRAAVYHTEGCRFDPGSGHSKFLFLQREFTSALGLKLPG